jgi:integrase
MALSRTRADRINKPGRYGDGRNLYLKVTETGSRSWIFRYELNGVEHVMGLGPCADFTLDEARERARSARQLLRDGIDPLEKAHEARARAAQATAKLITFKKTADSYWDFHAAKWTNDRYAKLCRMRLREYIFPAIGALPVGTIDKALILKSIAPIWKTKHKTAVRTLRLVKGILDYAKVQGWREGDNPAAWKANIEHALPALASNNHHAALPFTEIYDFMCKLRAERSLATRALEFTILTAARTGEVREAHWSEINLTDKTWVVPAERTKTGKEQRIPLSPQALEILQSGPRESSGDWVFMGVQQGKPLGTSSMKEALNRIHPGITVHGMRSTFRDWAAETTNYQNHIIEMALGHAIGNAVEAAYRRGDLFEKRRKLMVDWATYCQTAPRKTEDNVTPIRRKILTQ